MDGWMDGWMDDRLMDEWMGKWRCNLFHIEFHHLLNSLYTISDDLIEKVYIEISTSSQLTTDKKMKELTDSFQQEMKELEDRKVHVLIYKNTSLFNLPDVFIFFQNLLPPSLFLCLCLSVYVSVYVSVCLYFFDLYCLCFFA